jgi:hypothetical protein
MSGSAHPDAAPPPQQENHEGTKNRFLQTPNGIARAALIRPGFLSCFRSFVFS